MPTPTQTLSTRYAEQLVGGPACSPPRLRDGSHAGTTNDGDQFHVIEAWRVRDLVTGKLGWEISADSAHFSQFTAIPSQIFEIGRTGRIEVRFCLLNLPAARRTTEKPLSDGLQVPNTRA